MYRRKERDSVTDIFLLKNSATPARHRRACAFLSRLSFLSDALLRSHSGFFADRGGKSEIRTRGSN